MFEIRGQFKGFKRVQRSFSLLNHTFQANHPKSEKEMICKTRENEILRDNFRLYIVSGDLCR